MKFIRRCLGWLELRMDNHTVRRKFQILYVACVLVPLIITDSMIAEVLLQSAKETSIYETSTMATTVVNLLEKEADGASRIGKSINTSRYISEFLSKSYESPYEYVVSYQDFFKDTLFETGLGLDNTTLTMYADNKTIISGGKVRQLDDIRDNKVYTDLKKRGLKKGLYFLYTDDNVPTVQAERQMIFAQKIDYYAENSQPSEKFMTIKFNYGAMIRALKKMDFDRDIYVVSDGKVLLSNGKYANTGSPFQTFRDQKKVSYQKEISLYGTDMTIYIMDKEGVIWKELRKFVPILLLLVLVNIVFPAILAGVFNRSFTSRISQLSRAFETVDKEQLTPLSQVRGKDEIGSLMINYNKMVKRINDLIQIVYKNRLKEQEMIVERQNAELLALHSQINPHFLFNALESIRMHSVLKQEMETADMVEKLAVMQRQYVEWGEDVVPIQREMEFVRTYLSLQRYRFGDRLNFKIDVNDGCDKLYIPKLTIVTFVENACVHGVESKSTPGWIFVRVSKEDGQMVLEVEDTGVGMDPDSMKELEEKLQHANIDMLKKKGRVGMINAALRLKMFSEDQMHLELEGEEGVGMMISIRIPLTYVGEE